MQVYEYITEPRLFEPHPKISAVSACLPCLLEEPHPLGFGGRRTPVTQHAITSRRGVTGVTGELLLRKDT